MLKRDRKTGAILFSARTRRLDWEAASGALPSWLTLGASGSDAGATTTFGGTGIDSYLRIAPAASAASQATLIGPTVDLSKAYEVLVVARGVTFSRNSGLGVALGCWDANNGGRLNVPTSSPYMTLGSFRVSSTLNPQPSPTNYTPIVNREYRKPRTLCSLISTQDNWNYALEGDPLDNADGTIAAWQHGLMDTAGTTPMMIRCSTGSATPGYMQLTGVTMLVAMKD